jgi:hypothetical protein
MIWWTSLAPWEFESPDPDSLTSTFLVDTTHTPNHNEAMEPHAPDRFLSHRPRQVIELYNLFATQVSTTAFELVDGDLTEVTTESVELVPATSTPKNQPETLDQTSRDPRISLLGLIPEIRNPRPETRNPRPEIGNRRDLVPTWSRNSRPETRNPEPETRNPVKWTRPHPETRNLKPTTPIHIPSYPDHNP